MYKVRLFAGVSIEDANGAVSGAIMQRHRLALIALLATAPGQQLSRDKLIGWLWPEREGARARHLLRSAVHALRSSLGEAAILSLGDDLRLNPDVVRSDIADFLDLLTRDELESAVGLYRGPLLDGFHLNESSDFESWLDAERTRLARLYSGALEQLAQRAEARGDNAGGVEWWRRVAAVDPYSSRVALELMRALDAAGDRAAALRHARLHEQLLENELGAEPDPDVAALAEQIRTAPSPRVGVVAVPRVLTMPLDREIVAAAPADVTTRLPSTHRRLIVTASVIALAAAPAYGAYLLFGPDRAAQTATTKAAALPPSGRSIAVLPFTNTSGDPNEEYFSDGLTEELIAALARVRSLQVAARTSVFAFKDENRDVRQIARELGVAVVVEGNVRKHGDSIRVHAQLINAADGFHIWTESYDRNISDIFDLQSELALRIAEAMETRLTSVDRERLAKRSTDNLDAHTAYLRGRYYWKQRSGGGLTKAIQYFHEAIKADSQYDRAFAGLANAYGPLGVHGFLPPATAKEHMRAGIVRALEIEPDLAQARAGLAAYRHLYEWDFAGAEKEYLRAIELDAGESVSHLWYGFFLEQMGRHEEAIAQRTIARDLDPADGVANSGLGVTLLIAGRTRAAFEHIHRAVELDSTYWQAFMHLGVAQQMSDNLDAAVRAFERARATGGASPKPRAGLAGALAKSGRVTEAREIVEVLQAEAARDGVHAPIVAVALLALSDTAGALGWLERSYQQHHPDLLNTLVDPRLKPLQTHPRFVSIRRRIGLIK
jgi:TolB-like protein/DNA-binding SARP family transcriptional activator/Tfp pilus assembly protein PilF